MSRKHEDELDQITIGPTKSQVAKVVVHRVDDVYEIVVTPIIEIQTTHITQVIAAKTHILCADADPDMSRRFPGMNGQVLHGSQIVRHNSDEMMKRFSDGRLIYLCGNRDGQQPLGKANVLEPKADFDFRDESTRQCVQLLTFQPKFLAFGQREQITSYPGNRFRFPLHDCETRLDCGITFGQRLHYHQHPLQ